MVNFAAFTVERIAVQLSSLRIVNDRANTAVRLIDAVAAAGLRFKQGCRANRLADVAVQPLVIPVFKDVAELECIVSHFRHHAPLVTGIDVTGGGKSQLPQRCTAWRTQLHIILPAIAEQFGGKNGCMVLKKESALLIQLKYRLQSFAVEG